MKVITITIVLNRDVKNKKQRSLYLKKYFINFLFILKGIHTQWSLEKYEKKLRKKIIYKPFGRWKVDTGKES